MQGLRIFTRSGAAPTAEEIDAAHIVANTHKEMRFGTINQTEQTNGVEVEYHAHKNTAFVSSGLPYYVSGLAVSTPYDIDSISVRAEQDYIYSLSATGNYTELGRSAACPVGQAHNSYSWVITDTETGAIHSSGSGESYRCYTSSGGGGQSFTGYAINVPFGGFDGGTATGLGSIGSTSGCVNVTCHNADHFYYRVSEATYHSMFTRVTTTLQGVVVEIPYMSLGTFIWDGTEVITGRRLQLLYGFNPPWTSNTLSGYMDTLNGSDLGPASLSFTIPDRVAYTTSSITIEGTTRLMRLRRDMAVRDWNTLRDSLRTGTPPARFIQTIAPGVASGKAVRANAIEVTSSDTVVDQTTTRTIKYTYNKDASTVSGSVVGSKTTRQEPITKRGAVTRVTLDNFLDNTKTRSGNYLVLPNSSTSTIVAADTNIPAWERPVFLKEYWRSTKLIPLVTGGAAPTQYDATQNTPGVTADIVLFSAVVDGVPIGPLAVLDFPVSDTSLAAATQFAIHGVLRVKYDPESGQFIFVRWEDLKDYVVTAPSDVTLKIGDSVLTKYSGYKWEDLIATATLQDVEPLPTDTSVSAKAYRNRQFIIAAVRSAKSA